MLLVAVMSQLLLAQTAGTIKGEVTDAVTGDPLHGVIFYLKVTNMGVSTDLNGS